MIKIVLAPDSFKDSLSASKVCEAMEKGIKRVNNAVHFIHKPMADGGEGTVDALIASTNGKYIKTLVRDPLSRPVEAVYGILGDGKTAVIEMAKSSGIELLSPSERNPWITTTAGVGEMIKHALDQDCRAFIIGIGGSATNDAGAGMAQALGARLLDADKKQLKPGGGALKNLQSIDLSEMDARLKESSFLVACDVTNPLTGPNGASFIYGPQKGADADMVNKLDQNLLHFQNKVRDILKHDISQLSGGGAAGGLGAGLFVFLHADLKPGFDIIAKAANLEETIRQADYVITGEGKLDQQTRYGKTPSGVAGLAKKNKKSVIAMAGTLGEEYQTLFKQIDVIMPIIPGPIDLDSALKNASTFIADATERVFRAIWLDKK